jgi:hypothetical protein
LLVHVAAADKQLDHRTAILFRWIHNQSSTCMESLHHRHGKKARLLSPIACAVLATGFSTETLADITNVTSITQSSLTAEARVGTVSPPQARYADVQIKSIGDSAPVAGLPALSVGDYIYAIAASPTPGYVSSKADVRGSVGRNGEIVGDSLSVYLSGASGIDVTASLYRSGTGEPTNMVAQVAGTMTTVSKVTFTVNVPSDFRAAGHLDARGASTSRAWLVNDGNKVVLFDSVAMQSEYVPNAPSTTAFIDAVGSLQPGTYTLWATGLVSDRLEETVLSVPGQAPRTLGNFYFGFSFDIAPQ